MRPAAHNPSHRPGSPGRWLFAFFEEEFVINDHDGHCEQSAASTPPEPPVPDGGDGGPGAGGSEQNGHER